MAGTKPLRRPTGTRADLAMGSMLTYGPTRTVGQWLEDQRRSRATSPRRWATYGGDNNILVSHDAKEAVEVAGEHQRLTKDLAEAIVRPETPQARLATYARELGDEPRRTRPR